MPPLSPKYLEKKQANGNGHVRQEQLAIALDDLNRVDPLLRAKVLKGRLNGGSAPFLAEGKDKGTVAVLLLPPLVEAATLIDVLRSWDRELGDKAFRAWIKRAPGRSWERVPGNTLLTVAGEDGKVSLSPRWFPPLEDEMEAVEVAAPVARNVQVGRAAKRGN